MVSQIKTEVYPKGKKEAADLGRLLGILKKANFRGYVALDEPSGTMTPADATSATRTWRIALATKLLNHT